MTAIAAKADPARLARKPAPGHARVITVHGTVPGRLRLRVPALYRSQPLGTRIERRLARVSGVLRTETNVLTASVLVIHERSVRSEAIVSAVESELPPPAPADAGPPAEATGLLEGLLAWLSRSDRAPDSTSPPGETAPAGPAEGPDETWHARAPEAVLVRLGTSAGVGLDRRSATERLTRYGPNALPRPHARSAVSLLLEQVTTAPVALLGVSAGVSALTGGLLDAGVILAVVAVNAIIGFTTEQQAERIISALGDLSPRSAVVVRDGQSQEVSSETLVPGDILTLGPGTQVPADARLIACQRLSVDESALTGESMPVDKRAALTLATETPLAERENMVYMGSLVTGGSGTAVVVATGPRTQVGLIQSLAGGARPPETPMERQLDQMGTQLALLSGAVCAAVLGIGLLRGFGWIEMLKASISLAVAAVPEGLPTVATTTLALGIREMRQRKVLIRHLDAVETLGAVQVFCLDKTGTLTLNQMAATAIATGRHRYRASDGKVFRDGQPITLDDSLELRRLLEVLTLCSAAELGAPRSPGLNGTPTETALLRLAIDAGVDVATLRRAHPTIEVQHRSESRQYMVTIHPREGGGRLLAVKGSPAQVLELCASRLVDGRPHSLGASARRAVMAENDAMAGQALRVLGIAYAEQEGTETDPLPDLTWLGLVGLTDPVRPGMDWVLGRFHRAGIETVMITGDQSATAYAVGKELNLSQGQPLEILDSNALDRIDPELLAGMVRRVHVFSRVSPAHKLQIVQALQQAGLVVAMTGDGINDGPALKAADLGVAMGGSGTDVARSVADVILEDDNLHTMVVAVRQGRTVYGNIRKALRFLLSTNFTEIEVMLAGVALGVGQPLTPMQLLWINLISDIFPGLALALEPAEPDAMDRPPRDPAAPILSRADLLRLARESAVISTGALASYGYALARYGAGPQASTQAFMTLTLGQLLHALGCRSEEHSLFDRDSLVPNPYLDVALGVSLAAQALTVLVPGLRQLVGTVPIGLTDTLVSVAGAALPLAVNEVIKKRGAQRPRLPAASGDEPARAEVAPHGGEPRHDG